jgi:hypothetical protein
MKKRGPSGLSQEQHKSMGNMKTKTILVNGMTNAASSFNPRRSGGVRHLPEADIESIRDLIHGYNSARSILKELIQNAEDAGALRMDVLHVPRNPASPLSLLRGPGLLVANDGAFTEAHRDAITQISLGTKGTDDRAIGRFGKGLKSVFAWCEAFFIIARTDTELGWAGTSISDCFNPWHGWRHHDWDEEFDLHGDILFGEAEQYLDTIYPAGKPWLALWFPLRSQPQGRGAPAAGDSIFQLYPGDDTEFYQILGLELRSLTPSLVSLRSLQQISIVDRNAHPHDPLILEFSRQSRRIPAPDTAPGYVTPVDGNINLCTAESDTSYQYFGIAGRLGDEKVAHLKAAEDWPRVAQRTLDQNSANRPVKGEPHFATLITRRYVNVNELAGSLDVRWCVFFPVGKQPPDSLPVKLSSIPSHITINLHGFFFLDSERLRIDGLEESFTPDGTTATKSCLEWNRIVATAGTLARLPEAVAAFANQESFTIAQCRELADAIRQTWVWSAFQEAICHLETWRPRWRSGVEKWERISAEVPVLLIPNTSEPREILASIPMLAQVSEESTLVVGDDDSPPPGLHPNKASPWPEDLVLQLLEDVHLSSAGDEATAAWLNGFLNHLYADGVLTDAIRDRASALPLLPARVARTDAPVRLSAGDWCASVEAQRLFAPDSQTERWLDLLTAALPDWFCRVASSVELPQWFTGPRPPICDGIVAAKIILTEASLGSFVDRRNFVEAFASLPSRNPEKLLAMRFLMHASAAHAHEDAKPLFMPSTQHGLEIWPRLIEQLLKTDGGSDSWCLLHDQWASVLSAHLQQDLNVLTVNADGAWSALIDKQVDFFQLEFPPDRWPTDDLCLLLQGLFQAGQSKSRQDDTLALLRKLRLHVLRADPNNRVSVADEEGRLGELFVLNTPNFEVAPHLQALWEKFLAETKIVERLPGSDLASKVQEHIFERAEADGTIYRAKLDWNYVVRRSLEAAEPRERAPLILEALKKDGDQAARDLGPKLKKTAWLPLALGGTIAPDSVAHIEGLEDDLHRLLDPSRDCLAGIRAFPEWIPAHAGFATLRKYLPGIEETLKLLGKWLAEKSEWRLGLDNKFVPAELGPVLSQLEDLEILPAAAFLVKLRRIRIHGHDEEIDPLLRDHILPAVLKPFDYDQKGVERIETVLRRLQGGKNRCAFDAYLAQACNDGVLERILPNLSLVNQRGHWVPARQLIWPSANLDPAAQLCAEQAEILKPLRDNLADNELQVVESPQQPAQVNGHLAQLSQAPDFEAEAAKLSEYLEPFRNGNVGENLPAALVAVLGGHPTTRRLLRQLLQAGGLRQQPEDFIALLLGEHRHDLAQAMESTRFLIEIVREGNIEARTVTHEKMTVSLSNEISTLLVGDPSKHSYHHTYRIRLRWIEKPDETLPDRVAVFASTIEMILLNVYCNGISSICPAILKANLQEVLDKIDTGQTDLRRSRLYLLDMAEARLNELGIKGVPKLKAILQTFSEARQARVDADLLKDQAPSRARERSDEASRLFSSAMLELSRLLESPEEVVTQRTLVNAVRRKMTDFQYSLSSVPLELFQNADDAAAELQEMQNDLDPSAHQFVLHFDSQQRILEILHWGRPINRHESPGFRDGLKRGYDQDLQKMLTLNFSDKRVHANDGQALVTGRFGLGFKSVFFVSELPAIISARLAFEIRGGFFPVRFRQRWPKKCATTPASGARPDLNLPRYGLNGQRTSKKSCFPKRSTISEASLRC